MTAGLMWQPLMSPNALANTMMVSPCASATADKVRRIDTKQNVGIGGENRRRAEDHGDQGKPDQNDLQAQKMDHMPPFVGTLPAAVAVGISLTSWRSGLPPVRP